MLVFNLSDKEGTKLLGKQSWKTTYILNLRPSQKRAVSFTDLDNFNHYPILRAEVS